MKPDNFFSKAAKGILFVLCLAVSASQAYAEVKIESVSQTVGVMGKNMEVMLTGSGFTENTKVVMMPDYGNRKAIVGSVDTPGSAYDIKISDGKAYIADGSGGLQIIDVSDPKNPKKIGAVDTPGSAEDVYVSGNHAYIADGSGGLQIIDVSNPDSPKRIGNVDTPGSAVDVYVSGNYAYIADGDSGLQIIDVSNPENPRIIGKGVDTQCNAEGIYVSDNYAYVADNCLLLVGLLYIIDISNPYSPQIIGSVQTGPAYDVTVSGDGRYAFVAAGYGGLQIIDVSSPESPKRIGDGIYLGSYAGGVSVSSDGRYAFVADEESGLQIIDVSNPESPKRIGDGIDTPGSAKGVSLSADGRYAFVADGYSGLRILPLPINITPIALKNDKQMSVILPSPQITGTYSLFAYNTATDEKVYEFAGAVEFADKTDARVNILKAKAVIVAGTGQYRDNKNTVNDIWAETKNYADLAYKALRYQGYTEDNILYLSSEYTEGVNRYASKQVLQDAITTWAASDNPSSIMIYFVGHGDDKRFFINGAYNETVTADELKTWLDNTVSYRVTFVYDACKSGSFIQSLKVGNQPQGKERIIITGTSESQAAYFNSDNSFSNLFWSSIYGKTARKVDLYTAFQFASRQMRKDQTAMVETNGNGLTNESADMEILRSDVGRNYYDNVNIPVITDSSKSQQLQNESSADLRATVSYSGSDALTVWAEITPPNQSPPLPNEPQKTVNVIRKDLNKDESGVYRAGYDFPLNGTYTVVFYAKSQNSTVPSAPGYAAITRMQGTNTSQPDSYEPDDSNAKPVDPNNLRHNFHQRGDTDWVKFQAEAGKLYYFKATSLNNFCNPKIELYDNDRNISSDLQIKDGVPTWTASPGNIL